MRHSNAVSRGEFAKFCDVSPATVTNWMDAGMPATRTGRRGGEVLIDPAVAIPWVINHREPPGSQRERLAGEQADKVAMENEARRGRLVDAGLVEETLMSLAAYLAQAHDAVAGRLAHDLAGINDPGLIRAKVLTEMRDIREGIAQHGIRTANALENLAQDIERGKAAAEPDGESVGRSDEAPAGRKRRTRKVAKQ